MSNLIKSHYIFQETNKRIINSDHSFLSLSQYAEKVGVDEASDNNGFFESCAENQEQFNDGLNVVSMQRLIDEEEELFINKSEKILAEAQEKADLILQEAQEKAQSIKDDAFEEGKKLGYIEGFEQGQNEIAALEEKMQQERQANKEEYDKLVESLEPQFAEVVIELIKGISSVVVNDQKEVITYLIHKAMLKVEKSKNFVVKVSKEDYPYVTSKKEELLEGLAEDVELSIVEEAVFGKNQCLIETDGKFIDCSLDVQLNNLCNDLKLLANL